MRLNPHKVKWNIRKLGKLGKTHKNSKFQFSNIWFNLTLCGSSLTWRVSISSGINFPTSHRSEILHSLIFYLIVCKTGSLLLK